MDIYERLLPHFKRKRFKAEKLTLSAKLGIPRKKISAIFRRMGRMHKMATALKEADAAISRHRVKKVRFRKARRHRRV